MTDKTIKSDPLAEELGRVKAELANLKQVINVLHSTLDLDQVVQKVMQVLNEIFAFDQVSIYLYNAQKQCLEISYWTGAAANSDVMRPFQDMPLSLDWEEVYFIKAFLDNEPKLVSPITSRLLGFYCPQDRQMYAWNPHHAILICPLEVQEKVIGVINFVNTQKPFQLSEADIRRVQEYVANIASAINNAYLDRKNRYALALSQKREREVRHLNQVIQTTNATLNFDEVFQAISEGMLDVFEFHAVGIQLLDRSQALLNVFKVYGEVINPENIPKWRDVEIRLDDRESVSSYVFHTREPFYYPEVRDDAPLSEIDRRLRNIQPFSAYLAYPLVVRDKTIGVISFFRTEGAFDLDEEGLEQVSRYVSAISSAIHNAKNYESLKKAVAALNALSDALDSDGHGGPGSDRLSEMLGSIRGMDF